MFNARRDRLPGPETLKSSQLTIRGLGSMIRVCAGNSVSADISINCQKTYSSKPTIQKGWRERLKVEKFSIIFQDLCIFEK